MVFSASLSPRRRLALEHQVRRMAGNQIFRAAVTTTELRYGALAAGWGANRAQVQGDALPRAHRDRELRLDVSRRMHPVATYRPHLPIAVPPRR
jgi:hypothetical protein